MADRLTLYSRSGVAATDSVTDVGASQLLQGGLAGVASLIVSTTGSPTGYAVRACIEGSPDGGTTWHLLVRFKDITNAVTGNRIVRLPGVTAAGTADIASDALGSAEGTGTQVDFPWPGILRASTKVVTLSGGTAPTVAAAIYLKPA